MISTGAAAIKLLPSFIIRYEKCRKNILRIEYISLHLAPRLIRLKGGGGGGEFFARYFDFHIYERKEETSVR